MLQLNYRDPRPIYEQVKSEFRRLILSGALARGDRLPSVRELAGSLAINPNTIQRAYRELESEGYIIPLPGKGSFVTRGQAADESRLKRLWSQLDQSASELIFAGVSAEDICRRIREGAAHD